MTDKTTTWVKVCALTDVPANKAKGFNIAGQILAVARCGDGIFITQGTCSHMFYPLNGSKVDDCTLTCGLHRSQFDVSDGSVKAWVTFPPVIGAALAVIRQSKALKTYPAKIEDGAVFVEWTASDPDSVKVRL